MSSRIGHRRRESRRAAVAESDIEQMARPSGEAVTRPWWTLQRREAVYGVAFLLPAFIVFAVVIVYPFFYGLRLSFYTYNIFSRISTWVGLAQFRDTLSASGGFWHAFRITAIWAGGSVSLQVVLGVGAALLLNERLAGRAVLRGIVIFPYLVPTVAAVTIWKWMFDDIYGIVNQLLESWGLHHGPLGWLNTPRSALISLIVVGSWELFPFVFIAILARIQMIPAQLYDAAKVDGAGMFGRFWTITLPQIRSVLLLTIVLRLIWDVNNYDIVALLTNGGPVNGTATLPILVYDQLFNVQDAGLAAATGDLIVIGLGIALVGYFVANRHSEDIQP